MDKKRAKLATKAQTIEEIWESVSATKNGDLNPAPSRIVLTPRSAEACLRHGLNPEILRIRPLDSFSVPGIDPTVQRLRHETYTQRRFEMMRLVRAERKRLVNQEEREAELAAGGGGASAKITPQQIIAAQAKQNATFLDEEEKRMQKMRKRQDKELEQMMQFEVKMQEIQSERERRIALDKRKEEAAKRGKEKRARQVAEEQRQREAKKQAGAENEEARRLAASRAMFDRERQLRVERDVKEKKNKQEARAREEERLRKHEEHRLQTQRILAEQQAAIKRRMDDMELAERERQALVMRKRQEERDRLALRRAQMEARIERNMQQAAKVEEGRAVAASKLAAAARGRYTGVDRLFVSVRAAPGEAAATLKGQHQQKSDRRAWSLSAVRREVCEPAQTWNQTNKETINNETIKLMPIFNTFKKKDSAARSAAEAKKNEATNVNKYQNHNNIFVCYHFDVCNTKRTRTLHYMMKYA